MEHAFDSVGSHAVHAPPPAPQVGNETVVHVAPAQHPVGHELRSHWQPPFVHS
jgi:hypothetical protein